MQCPILRSSSIRGTTTQPSNFTNPSRNQPTEVMIKQGSACAQTGTIAPTSRQAWGGGQALVQLGRFLVPIAALLLIWEVAVRGGWIAANIFPAPSMVFARASELIFSTGPDRGMLLTHIAASLYRAIVAFGLSVLIAIPLGFLLGLLPRVYKWLSPILSLMLPLPAVAWTPI